MEIWGLAFLSVLFLYIVVFFGPIAAKFARRAAGVWGGVALYLGLVAVLMLVLIAVARLVLPASGS